MKNLFVWVSSGAILYINTAIMIYQGIIRFTHYQGGGAFYKGKFAYVGGDAYNLIINSNMQIGFFVLAAASFIAGTLLICTGALVNSKKSN